MVNSGEKLRKFREDLELNKNQFAKELGVNNSLITQYESGKSRPGKKFIEKILERYPDFNEGYLFDEHAEMRKIKSYSIEAGSKEDYEQQVRKLQADINRLQRRISELENENKELKHREKAIMKIIKP